MAQITVERLTRWLVEAELLTPDDLAQVEFVNAQSLASSLVEQKVLKEADLVAVVSRQLGVPKAPRRLYKASVSHNVLSSVPEDICWQHHVFPFGVDRNAGRLQVAMTDPTDEEARATLQEIIGHDPLVFVVGPRALEKAIRKHYLDSWVDETGGRRRFFGYDNITNPGARARRSPSSDEIDALLAEPEPGPRVRHIPTPPPESVEDLRSKTPTPPPEPAVEPGTASGKRPHLDLGEAVSELDIELGPLGGEAASLDEDRAEDTADGKRRDESTYGGTGGPDLPAAPSVGLEPPDPPPAHRVPDRGYGFDQVRATQPDVSLGKLTQPGSGLALTTPGHAEKGKRAPSETGPKPRQPAKAAVALARIGSTDDRFTTLVTRVRLLEGLLADTLSLLADASDEGLAERAAELQRKLSDS